MAEACQCLTDGQLVELARRTLCEGAVSSEEIHLEACSSCQARQSLVADPPSPLTSGEMIGPYVIGERLAMGGMGVLYTAVHSELKRRVALKVTMPGRFRNDSSGQLRLLHEAQAMAQLAHPNIVTVYDAGTFGERVFIAMEFVEGTTLGRWLQETNRTWRQKVEAFLAAGRGLAAAHRVGLVHRDFKPDNVLVSRDGRVLVTDFGLVRRMSREPDVAGEPSDALPAVEPLDASPVTSMTLPGTVLGTPGFMAPEQARGGAADARSDQFSFFASLWEGFFDQMPYAGDTIGEILRNTESSRRQPVPSSSPVPARVRRVLEKGLAPEPADRFQTLDDALVALERATRPRHPRAGVALVLAAAAVSLLAWTLFYPRMAPELPGSPAEKWLADMRPHCNPVEVAQSVASLPPPTGWEGAGSAAACFALAGDVPKARQLIRGLPNPNDRPRAAEIVFEVGHDIADHGDNVATSAIMKLVLEFWPNAYKALFHAGMADFALGHYENAEQLLVRFLREYRVEDGFRRTAEQTLAQILQQRPSTAPWAPSAQQNRPSLRSLAVPAEKRPAGR